MIPRAVVSLSTHVSTRSDNRSFDSEILSGRDFIVSTDVGANQRAKMVDRYHGIIGSLVGLDSMMFPLLSHFCADIGRMVGERWYNTTECTWPPRSENMDREEWIMTTSYPILPEGRESEVALARVRYPIVHIRTPMMGPEYIKAVSILSGSKQEAVDLNIDDQWFLPDVNEYVDFTPDRTHTFHKL